ncbi:kelch-like [Paramarasmius palmivorus]|uniref:Kelch-like n=1 Tax=Paramarasmius palmivorus TaxID=297713 RepID=A0AAW0BC94_9AGAR
MAEPCENCELDFCEAYASGVMNTFRKLRRYKATMDVNILAGDSPVAVPAHQALLCSSSNYFACWFSIRPANEDRHVVEAKAFDRFAVSKVIDLVYAMDDPYPLLYELLAPCRAESKGQMLLGVELVFDVYDVAVRWEIAGLPDLIQTAILAEEIINPTTATEVLARAKRSGATDIVEVCNEIQMQESFSRDL